MSHGVHAVQHEAEHQMEHDAKHGGHGEGHDKLNKRVALLIAFIALFLAFSETLGKSAQTAALNYQTQVGASVAAAKAGGVPSREGKKLLGQVVGPRPAATQAAEFRARHAPQRPIWIAGSTHAGEEERVLRAIQTVIDEKLAWPILIGRPSVVDMRIQRFGLRMRRGEHFDLVNPEDDPRYRDYVATYLEVAGRRGITPDTALRRSRFALLRKLLGQLNASGHQLDTLSMGMSDDLEDAIAEGATVVRVGTAIFGKREAINH